MTPGGSNSGGLKGFLARLRLYVFGIVIGLMMLGFFFMAKKNEAARRQAEAERAKAQPAAPDPLFPALPKAEPKPEPKN